MNNKLYEHFYHNFSVKYKKKTTKIAITHLMMYIYFFNSNIRKLYTHNLYFLYDSKVI